MEDSDYLCRSEEVNREWIAESPQAQKQQWVYKEVIDIVDAFWSQTSDSGKITANSASRE
jgi:hypothetical protein